METVACDPSRLLGSMGERFRYSQARYRPTKRVSGSLIPFGCRAGPCSEPNLGTRIPLLSANEIPSPPLIRHRKATVS